jgi:hypothetical protein
MSLEYDIAIRDEDNSSGDDYNEQTDQIIHHNNKNSAQSVKINPEEQTRTYELDSQELDEIEEILESNAAETNNNSAAANPNNIVPKRPSRPPSAPRRPQQGKATNVANIASQLPATNANCAPISTVTPSNSRVKAVSSVTSSPTISPDQSATQKRQIMQLQSIAINIKSIMQNFQAQIEQNKADNPAIFTKIASADNFPMIERGLINYIDDSLTFENNSSAETASNKINFLLGHINIGEILIKQLAQFTADIYSEINSLYRAESKLINQLKSENSQLSDQVKQLKAAVAVKSHTNTANSSDSWQLQHELDVERKSLNAEKLLSVEQRNEIKRLRELIEELKEEKRIHIDIEAERSHEIAALKQEIEQNRVELHQYHPLAAGNAQPNERIQGKDYKIEAGELAKRCADQSVRISALTAELEDVKEASFQLEGQYTALQQQFITTNLKFNSKNEQIQHFKETLQNNMQTIVELQQKLEENKQSMQETDQNQGHYEQQLGIKQEKIKALENQVKSLKQNHQNYVQEMEHRVKHFIEAINKQQSSSNNNNNNHDSMSSIHIGNPLSPRYLEATNSSANHQHSPSSSANDYEYALTPPHHTFEESKEQSAAPAVASVALSNNNPTSSSSGNQSQAEYEKIKLQYELYEKQLQQRKDAERAAAAQQQPQQQSKSTSDRTRRPLSATISSDISSGAGSRKDKQWDSSYPASVIVSQKFTDRKDKLDWFDVEQRRKRKGHGRTKNSQKNEARSPRKEPYSQFAVGSGITHFRHAWSVSQTSNNSIANPPAFPTTTSSAPAGTPAAAATAEKPPTQFTIDPDSDSEAERLADELNSGCYYKGGKAKSSSRPGTARSQRSDSSHSTSWHSLSSFQHNNLDSFARMSRGLSSSNANMLFKPYINHLAHDIQFKQYSSPFHPSLPIRKHLLIRSMLTQPKSNRPKSASPTRRSHNDQHSAAIDPGKSNSIPPELNENPDEPALPAPLLAALAHLKKQPSRPQSSKSRPSTASRTAKANQQQSAASNNKNKRLQTRPVSAVSPAARANKSLQPRPQSAAVHMNIPEATDDDDDDGEEEGGEEPRSSAAPSNNAEIEAKIMELNAVIERLQRSGAVAMEESRVNRVQEPAADREQEAQTEQEKSVNTTSEQAAQAANLQDSSQNETKEEEAEQLEQPAAAEPQKAGVANNESSATTKEEPLLAQSEEAAVDKPVNSPKASLAPTPITQPAPAATHSNTTEASATNVKPTANTSNIETKPATDPNTTITATTAITSASQLLCDLCDQAQAEVHCTACDMNLCAALNGENCDAQIHAVKAKASHQREPIQKQSNNTAEQQVAPPAAAATAEAITTAAKVARMCELCEEQDAVLFCSSCNLHFCETNGCDAEMHATAKMKNHQRNPLEAI